MTQHARGIVLTTGLLVVVCLLGAGCHDPFSNQWFEDDALFLAAIPDEERVTTRVPVADDAERRGSWGEDAPPPPAPGIASLAVWTWQASWELNTFIATVLYAVEWVTSTPIAWRSEYERIWGPVDADDDPATDLAIWLYMDRLADGVEDRFDYSLEWRGADTARDGGIVPIRGSFVAGASPREGVGDFRVDYALMHELEQAYPPEDPEPDPVTGGELVVDHDYRDGVVELAVGLRGVTTATGGPWDADYAFTVETSGAGWFEYAADGNLEDSDPTILEHWEIRTRWQADGAGRGDARISGGELGGFDYVVTECWDEDLRRTYYGDDTGFTVEWGDPDHCVFPDQELPTHL